MQCEVCSEPGTVAVTEIERGHVVDIRLCPHHAAKRLGCPTPEQWKDAIASIAARFEADGAMPNIAEISQLGEVGTYLAKQWPRPHAHVAAFLQTEVDKYLRNKPGRAAQ